MSESIDNLINMPQTIRTFIAIKLPENTITSLREVQEGIRSHGIHLRWVRPENIHLTLKFLGDIKEDNLEKITAALHESIAAYEPISLYAKGLGVFPGIKRPRVVWVGIAGQLESLIGLQQSLEQGLEGLGFEKEKRPFKGHLTLGRIKRRIDPKQLGNALIKYDEFKSETFSAENIVMYKSELKPTGAVYTEIVKIPLGE